MTDALWPVIMVSIAILAAFFSTIIVWRIRRERKSGFPVQDERTSRINGKAALWAYWIGCIFMVSEIISIIIGNESLGLPEPGAGWVLIATMLVFSLSFGILRWYYGRKGDL